jgi:hypothetical protein
LPGRKPNVPVPDADVAPTLVKGGLSRLCTPTRSVISNLIELAHGSAAVVRPAVPDGHAQQVRLVDVRRKRVGPVDGKSSDRETWGPTNVRAARSFHVDHNGAGIPRCQHRRGSGRASIHLASQRHSGAGLRPEGPATAAAALCAARSAASSGHVERRLLGSDGVLPLCCTTCASSWAISSLPWRVSGATFSRPTTISRPAV